MVPVLTIASPDEPRSPRGGHVGVREVLRGKARCGADRVLGAVQHDRYALVDAHRHVAAGRDVRGEPGPQHPLDVGGGQPDLGLGPVEHDEPGLRRVVEQVEHVQGDPQVLERRQLGRGHQDVDVRRVERGQHRVAERRRSRPRRSRTRPGPARAPLRPGRGRSARPSAGATGASSTSRFGWYGVSSVRRPVSSSRSAIGIASAMVRSGVSCSMMPTSPKARSRSIRQTLGLAGGGQRDGEVRGDHGLAGAALAGEDRDHLTPVLRCGVLAQVGRCRRDAIDLPRLCAHRRGQRDRRRPAGPAGALGPARPAGRWRGGPVAVAAARPEPERVEPERVAPERAGSGADHRRGPERRGHERRGHDRGGHDRGGHDRGGHRPGSARPGWARPEETGPQPARPRRARPEETEPERARPRRARPRRARPRRARRQWARTAAAAGTRPALRPSGVPVPTW